MACSPAALLEPADDSGARGVGVPETGPTLV